jgi:fumarate reductase subunit C
VPGPAHPDAMRSPNAERTRTAPPRRPDEYPFSGRYKSYTLFGLTGILYMLLGFLALEVVWALGDGEAAWNGILERLQNPLYIAFHAVSLAGVCLVGVRFFGLFPKSQPPRIGPAKPPPAAVFLVGLYGAWIGITVALAAVLAGALS